MSLTRASAAVIKTEELVNNRNKIINGAMEIDQRNAGASISRGASGASFGVDRFNTYVSSGTYSLQQVSDAPVDFKNSHKITVTSVGSSGTSSAAIHFEQKIEGYNVADLNIGTSDAKTVTLSFWVKSSITGTYSLHFGNDSDRFYVTTYAINSANTWEYKTITVILATSGTWNTTTGRGLEVVWSLLSGSDFLTSSTNEWITDEKFHATGSVQFGETNGATWQITGVQLEVGSVATPFERRPFGTELALCQRYCIKSFNQGTAVATNTGSFLGVVWFGQVAGASTAQSVQGVRFPVTMRATPSVTIYNPDASNNEIRRVAGSDWSSTTLAAVGENSFGIFATSPAGSNVGDAAAYHYLATAEL